MSTLTLPASHAAVSPRQDSTPWRDALTTIKLQWEHDTAAYGKHTFGFGYCICITKAHEDTGYAGKNYKSIGDKPIRLCT
jgi:hypothetical protein